MESCEIRWKSYGIMWNHMKTYLKRTKIHTLMLFETQPYEIPWNPLKSCYMHWNPMKSPVHYTLRPTWTYAGKRIPSSCLSIPDACVLIPAGRESSHLPCRANNEINGRMTEMNSVRFDALSRRRQFREREGEQGWESQKDLFIWFSGIQTSQTWGTHMGICVWRRAIRNAHSVWDACSLDGTHNPPTLLGVERARLQRCPPPPSNRPPATIHPTTHRPPSSHPATRPQGLSMVVYRGHSSAPQAAGHASPGTIEILPKSIWTHASPYKNHVNPCLASQHGYTSKQI